MTLAWPKCLAMSSKWAHFTCLGTLNGIGICFKKTFQPIFDPLWTHYWSQNNPFSRHFGTLEGPKWLAVGSKWADSTCLGTPNALGLFLGKAIFDSFLTHFVSQRSPFSSLSRTLGGPKRARWISKRAENTCFGIPCGRVSSFKKVIFFCTRWTLLTHFGVRLFGLPFAPCRSPLGLGIAV